MSALALKHEVSDGREDGIDAEVLSIVPSADGTALFCGLASRSGLKSGPITAMLRRVPAARTALPQRRPHIPLTTHPGRRVHRSLGRRPYTGSLEEQDFSSRHDQTTGDARIKSA